MEEDCWLRDMLIREYFDVDLETAWDVIKNKLPELKRQASEPPTEIEQAEKSI